VKRKRMIKFATAGLAAIAGLFVMGLLGLAAESPGSAIAALWMVPLALGAISVPGVPMSTRRPGRYFEINRRVANSSLPDNKLKVMLLGQRLKALVEPARFQGGTLNDCVTSGTYTGTNVTTFLVKISTAAATDKFQYSTDNGENWSAETDITGAAQSLDDGAQITFGATTGHAVDDEWRFRAYPEPGVAKETPTPLFTADEAATGSGYGSIIHRLVKAALKANRYVDLSFCALDDGDGTASVGDITFSGPATKAGSVTLHIGDETTEVAFVKDATKETVAAALEAECWEKHNDLQVFTWIDDTAPEKIGLKAKNKGTLGDQIKVSCEITPNSGISASITAMNGGATDPDIDDVLDDIFPGEYDIVVSAWNDATSLGKLNTHMTSVSGPLEQRACSGYYGAVGALATETTKAVNLNHKRLRCIYLRYTSATPRQTTPYEIAAEFASLRAFYEDPALPLDDVYIEGIAPPAPQDVLSGTEQESCLFNGVTPLQVGPNGKVQIVRYISTYVKNDEGVDDDAWLDGNYSDIMDYTRKACRTAVSTHFKQAKQVVKTPKRVEGVIFGTLKNLDDAEIIMNVEARKDELKAENTDERGRTNVQIPVTPVTGLHIVAGILNMKV
jgi:phage tail sheath gpL-like